MMNTQRIRELIAHPTQVDAQDRPGLKSLVDRYPHSPGLAMLLARSSQLSGDLDEQRDLLRAAAMLESREALFDLLVRPEILKEARAIHEQLEESGNEERGELGNEEPGNEERGGGPGGPGEPGNEELRGGPGGPGNEELGNEEPGGPGNEELGNEERGEPGVEREVLLSAIESTIELDVAEWEREQRSAKAAVQESTASDEPPGLEDKKLPEVKKVEPSEGGYAAWLKGRAEVVSFGTLAGQGRGEEPAQHVPKRDVNVLIDKFLEVQPKIGPIRDVDRSVEDLAKQSVLEDQTLMTETMARVFAKQGQIGRAKRIYQQLSLKYPAKSTYFAAQLKKLGKGS